VSRFVVTPPVKGCLGEVLAEGVPRPPPREELSEFRLWHVGDAGEDVGEPSLRIDVVKFCGLDERVDERGRSASRFSQNAALAALRRLTAPLAAVRLCPGTRRFSLAAASILGFALRPGVAAAPASDASAESAMFEWV
jgi:hypothetical protein